MFFAGRAVPSSFWDLEGFSHPLTEAFAQDLYIRTPVAAWPTALPARSEVWERAPHATRAVFRERARRFIAGDLSVAPWAVIVDS